MKGMMCLFIKKIAAFSAALIVLLSSYAYGSSFYTVHDLTEEIRLSTGITYEKIQKFTSIGWMNINVVRADLTDQYTQVKPINSEAGVSVRSPLSSIMKSSGASAAVNGDFFYMGDPTYTYGPLIDNGKLITSPLPYSSSYPTVSRLLDNNVNISVWNPIITLYGSDSTAYNVVVLNKTSSLDWGPTILTRDWNTLSPGYDGTKDIVEVVVVGQTVTEVRKNQASTTIPEDGYVIASRNATTIAQLEQSFIPGLPATLDIQLDFNPENVEFAFGALNYLVKNGQLNDVSNEALGSNPRTAIGFNKDNTEMIMVTIDGRNKNYVGVKQTELAEILLDLGAYNAVNMDGGGSTTMGIDFLKNSNITVVNIPSDGKERKIASGVGVFNTSPDSNNIGYIEIAPTQKTVFNNTEVGMELKLYNEYYTPIEAATGDVNYTVSPADAGKVVNNIFYPAKAGKAVITAETGAAQGQVEINVLDTPVALDFHADSLTFGLGDTYEMGDILGIDKNGDSAYIPAKYISYTFRNKIGTIENGIFTAGDVNNTGAITATFGNATKNILVKVGYRYKTLNSFENLVDLKLSLYPEASSGNMSTTKDFVKEGSAALKLDYDFTQMTDQSIAFVELGKDGEGIKLEDKPKAIGMWVYGDGKNHWLRARIIDSNNNQIKLTFEDEVNWSGWKWVEAVIPDGTAYPITLKNIYLAEINETKKDSGTIYIDNLRILYEPIDMDFGLQNETSFVDYMKAPKISDYSEKLVVTDDKKEILSAKGEIIYFDGIITNATMSAGNTTMWNNIKSLVNYENKVLVLTMNTSIDSISDEREIKVLKEILEKASEKNQVFVVYKADKENTIIENGIRYIAYDDTLELGITPEGLKYKN